MKNINNRELKEIINSSYQRGLNMGVLVAILSMLICYGIYTITKLVILI